MRTAPVAGRGLRREAWEVRTVCLCKGACVRACAFLVRAVRSLHAGRPERKGGLTFFVYAGSLGKPLDGWVILVLYRKEL